MEFASLRSSLFAVPVQARRGDGQVADGCRELGE